MQYYRYYNIDQLPRVYTVLILGSAWLGLIAVAALISLSGATSLGDVVTRVLLAAMAAAGAFFFLRTALRFGPTGEQLDSELRAVLAPRQTAEEGDTDREARAA